MDLYIVAIYCGCIMRLLSAKMGTQVCDVVESISMRLTYPSQLSHALCPDLLQKSWLRPNNFEPYVSVLHTNGGLDCTVKILAGMTSIMCQLPFWNDRAVALASLTQADQWKDAVSLVQSMCTNGYPPGGLLLSNVIAS